MTLTDLAKKEALDRVLFFYNDGLHFDDIIEQLTANNFDGIDPGEETAAGELVVNIVHYYGYYLKLFTDIANGKYSEEAKNG